MRLAKEVCSSSCLTIEKLKIKTCLLLLIEDVMAATSVLQQRANEIRNNSINWQSYLQ